MGLGCWGLCDLSCLKITIPTFSSWVGGGWAWSGNDQSKGHHSYSYTVHTHGSSALSTFKSFSIPAAVSLLITHIPAVHATGFTRQPNLSQQDTVNYVM